MNKQSWEGPGAGRGGDQAGEGPGNKKRPGKIHGSLKVPLVQSFKEGQKSSSENRKHMLTSLAAGKNPNKISLVHLL